MQCGKLESNNTAFWPIERVCFQASRNQRLLLGLAFSFCLLASPMLTLQAPAASPGSRAPLRGSASIEVKPFPEEDPLGLSGGPVQTKLGSPWYPSRTATLNRAEQLVDDYALNEAQKRFYEMLQRNPYYAPAHNGLGMVDWRRTGSSNQNVRNKTTELQQRAIQHFLTALRYQPNYIEARLNLGSVYFEQGRYGEAHEEFTRAFLLARQDAHALEKMGMSLAQAGREHEALPYLEKSAQLLGGNHSVQYWLGKAYMAKGDENRAHQALMEAISLYPKNAPAWHQLGLLYQNQGNGAAAVDAFKKAIAFKPEYREPSFALSRHYENRGDFAGSLETLKNLYEAYPEDTDLLYHITDVAMRNHQPDIAINYYEHRLFQEPDDPRAIDGLSNAHAVIARESMGIPDLTGEAVAVHEAQQSLEYRPDNYRSRFIQVKLDPTLGPMGNMPMPSREMDAVLYQSPVDVKTGIKQAEVLLWRFQFRDAQVQYRALLNATDTPAASLAFGEMMLESGLPMMAEESFHKTLARDPNNKPALLGLKKVKAQLAKADELYVEADVFRRKRHYTKAIALLKESLKLNIRHAKAHYRLAATYETAKQYAQAADHYYAYVQLEPGPKERERVNKHIARLKREMLSSNR